MDSRILICGLIGAFLAAGCNNEIYYVRRKNIGGHFCDENRYLTTANLNGTYQWSPDGEILAFTQSETPGDEAERGNSLMVREGTHGVDRELVHRSSGKIGHTIDWAPDGSAIVYDHDFFCSGCKGNISIARLTGGAPRLMTPLSTDDREPNWSPTGGRIAFISRPESGDYDLYWMNSDGTGRSRMTSTIDTDHDPIWSPDGEYIAFSRRRMGEAPSASIEVIRKSELTGATRTIASGLTDLGGISWASDGSKLLFHGAFSPDWETSIFSVNADGSGLRNLSIPDPGSFNISDKWASWSPDGSQIAFTRKANFRRGEVIYLIQGALFRMNADGTGKERLTEEDAVHSVQWRPKAQFCW